MAGQWIIEDAPAGKWVIDDQPTAKPALAGIRGEGYDKAMNYSGRDAIGGAIRGAGSIGSTVLSPFESGSENTQRRRDIDAGLSSLIGSNPESTGYQTTKLATEVAGTLGMGGGFAGLLGKIPGAANAIPGLISAIRTGGMSAGGYTGAGGAATRAAGGAVTGALTAGAVNLEDADTGAYVGALLPPILQLAGKGGQAIGAAAKSRAVEQAKEISRNAPRRETLQAAIDAGYVVPPNMVNPSFTNSLIESISGKQATQQIFSAKNEKVTGNLVRQSLGLLDDAPITQGALENLRKTAGKTYAEVSNLSPQAAADLEALKAARSDAQGWFQAYNRSARPDDLVKAKEARLLSDSLENALEGHASTAGMPELIPSLRDARKQIAKTYTVGRTLNDASGTVDARILGRMHEKGLPLSDGLDVAGRFASAFPTVAKASQQVGSPAAHNLKSIASMAMAGGGIAAMGPMGVVAAGLPFVAPPLARAAMLRQGAQKGLLDVPEALSGNSELAGLLTNQELQQFLLRAAPAISGR